MASAILYDWDFIFISLLIVCVICFFLYVLLHIIQYLSFLIYSYINKEKVIPIADEANIEPNCEVEYAIEVE